ncbi:MAG: hypothetical protein IJ587_07725 [Synergistaceae bacterium]|nr:hypothetical protein [Synergistaceae bacterium]
MSKLELLYQPFEEKGLKAKSATAFCKKFVTSEEAEDNFNTAIREIGFVGFKAGFATAMALFTEAGR